MKKLNLINFAQEFRRALENAGYYAGSHENNYRAFARRANIDQTSVRQYLSGKYKPTLHTLQKMCDVLQVPVEHFTVGETQSFYEPAKTTPVESKSDWRLIEVATNQIATATLLHHDEESNVVILKLN